MATSITVWLKQASTNSLWLKPVPTNSLHCKRNNLVGAGFSQTASIISFKELRSFIKGQFTFNKPFQKSEKADLFTYSNEYNNLGQTKCGNIL